MKKELRIRHQESCDRNQETDKKELRVREKESERKLR
jgi:hypothetical protein